MNANTHYFIIPGCPRVELSMISRDAWGADEQGSAPVPLQTKPPAYVIVKHTETQFCSNETDCKVAVHVIQSFHMLEKGLIDIGYNFLVGGDGNVYEGRGWDVQGHHTHDYDQKSIGVGIIGMVSSVEPTELQINALKNLIEYGVQNGKIEDCHHLIRYEKLTSDLERSCEELKDIDTTIDCWYPYTLMNITDKRDPQLHVSCKGIEV